MINSDKYADFSFSRLKELPPLNNYTAVQLAGNEFQGTQDLSNCS